MLGAFPPILNTAPAETPGRRQEELLSSMAPKVLFINPPSIPYNHLVLTLEDKHTNLSNFLRQPIAMPMGILYLSSVLERDFDGIEIRILDYAKALRECGMTPDRPFGNIHEFIDYFLDQQIPAGFTPDFVGLSILFSTAHRTSGLIAEAVKRRWPDTPVVVGGMHSTNAVPTLLDMPAIDYVCRGEAESIVGDLLTRFCKKTRVNRQDSRACQIGRCW